MGFEMDRTSLLQFFQEHARLLLDRDYKALAESYGMPVSFHFVAGDILMETEAQLTQVMRRHREGLVARGVEALQPWVSKVDELAPGRAKVSVTWLSQVVGQVPLRTDATYFIRHCDAGPRIDMVDFSVPAPSRYKGLFFEPADAIC